MWRVLVLFGALSCGCYVYRIHGEDAASAVFSGLCAVILTLGQIELRLAAILEVLHAKRTGGACEIIGPVSKAQKIQEEQC